MARNTPIGITNMKYIRTKDGIYEIDETTILTSMPPCYKVIKPTDKYYAINEKSVINQADTIEELCDEFVWVSIENEYHNRKANEYGLRTSKMQVNSPQMKTIYGAIWTEWGLKYVAKMNEKGVFELI